MVSLTKGPGRNRYGGGSGGFGQACGWETPLGILCWFHCTPLLLSLKFQDLLVRQKVIHQTCIECFLQRSWTGVSEERQKFSWQFLPLRASQSRGVPNSFSRNSLCCPIMTLRWADFQTLWHTANYVISFSSFCVFKFSSVKLIMLEKKAWKWFWGVF